MRTRGHREESTTHYGLSGGNRGRTVGGGELGRESVGEMPDTGDREEGSESHCHVCTYATILQFFTCNPKPKMQLRAQEGITT